MKIKLLQMKMCVAELDTTKAPNKTIIVNAKNDYQAQVILEEGEEMPNCFLQVGLDPDHRAELTPDGWFKGKDSRGFYGVKLFAGTIGASFLFLFKEDVLGEGGLKKIRLATVFVVNDEKKVLYDEMVRQLILGEMPQYVVTDFKWQMRCNNFRLGWDDGYATYVDDVTMLRELEALTKDIKGRLNRIALRPYEQIRSEVGYVYASRLKKLDTRGRRSFEKSLRLSNAYEHKVVARKKCVSPDTLAHDVIKTFLLEQKSRLKTIRESLQKEIDEVKATLNNDATNSDWRRDCKVKIEELKNYQGRAKQLEDNFVQFLEMAILKTSQKRVTIFEVNPSVFMINQAYYGLCQVMLAFARKSFWWNKDRALSWKKRPRLLLDEVDDKFRAQFKYSIVYENWCIAHFCWALEQLGYEMEKVGSNVRNNCYSYAFVKGDVVLRLLHGVVAIRRGGEFYSRRLRTPDFAIVISRKDSNNFAWMLGDAKSGGELNERMCKVYTHYEVVTRCEKKPFAILVVLSGESEKDDRNGVIFPRPYLADDDDKKSWEADYSGYKWACEDGITGDFDIANGAMYMNGYSFSLRENVKELMSGLIKTGLRKIDEENECL